MQIKPMLVVRLFVFLAITVAGGQLVTHGAAAQGRDPSTRDVVRGHEAASNEVLVKFRGAQMRGERDQTDALVDADRDDDLNDSGLRLIHSRRFDAATLVSFFQGAPNVEYAEPNFILYAINTPNDPSFGSLWGLRNTGQIVGGQAGTPGADIDAAPAWDISTGSTANVVGVVDTGVDYNHPDLSANIWSAPASFTVTIGGSTITCDVGTHGFNAITNTCNPLDDNDHGSHVSGTIGAVGNNGVGVAGVNWTASIMGLKFLNSAGSGTTANAINAIEFAIQAKSRFGAQANVRVLSNSWGCSGALCFSQALLDEINKAGANDMLFVAAAGNNGTNNDSTPFYPANYSAANLVAVAATDNRDAKASFSNYGATMVDLGAPGVSILSTTRNNTYSSFSGTSMATPHVSGAAALVLSKCTLTTANLKSTILNNVDPIAALAGITITGGRLNVNKALTSCAGTPPPPGPPPAPTGLTATGGNAQVSLQWTASTGATSYNVKRGTTSGGPYTTVGSPTATTFIDTTVTNGTTYFYVVTALKGDVESGNSNQASATPSAPPPPSTPPAPTGLTATPGPGRKQISLTWSASTDATSYTVKRSDTSGGPITFTASTSSTSFTNFGLTSGKVYYYVVTAVNANGESPPSNPASAAAR